MTPNPIWISCLSFVVLVSATLSWIYLTDESLDGLPGREGDDVYFENIAWNIHKNASVALDFEDETWRRPYRDDNADGRNDWILDIAVRGKTTSRSPGFPCFAAMIYKAVGRNWRAVRIAQVFLLAIALSCITAVVYHTAGPVAAGLATVTLAADFFVLRTAGQFMSEALGTSAIAFLFCTCLKLSKSSSLRSTVYWLPAGIAFGLGALIRANLNAWLLLILASALILISWRMIVSLPVKCLFYRLVFFGAGVVLVAAPWWIGNCQVTGGLAPFGTSGSFGLSGGYCDPAYDNFGNWSLETVLESQQASLKTPGFGELSLAEQEYQMASDSARLAWAWTVENPGKIPSLMLMKGYSHLGFYGQPVWLMTINLLFYFGAAIGCYARRENLGRWVLIFLLLSLASTMLTWSHFGRYSIPIRPLLHAACAIGTVHFWRWMAGFKQPATTSFDGPS